VCGIAGGIAPRSSAEWRFDILWRQLWYTEDRGKDASGVGWHDANRSARVVKAPLRGSEFINTPQFEDIYEEMPTTWIAHCRATTKGTEKNNVNNHPVYSKQTQLMLVHNGMVQDEKWRVTRPDGTNPYVYAPFDGEVDTEAILRVLETTWLAPRDENGRLVPEIVENTAKELWTPQVSLMKAIDDAVYNIQGGFALSILAPDEPDTVYLVKHNNPIFVAYFEEEDAIIWTSTENIFKGVIAGEKKFGFFPPKRMDYLSVEPENDSLVRISAKPEGGFDIEQKKITPPTYERHGNYRTGGKVTA
jgi:glucosamine--fructose-6-phosphate aminotransferase (isomerizing)